MPNAEIPADIARRIDAPSLLTLTGSEEKNDLLTVPGLRNEVGYARMDVHCCVEYRNLVERLPDMYAEAGRAAR